MHRTDPHPLSFATVHDRSMAYVELGAGAPIVFLHGNPTSSYLWRTVMPELAEAYRCLAPDLIGMGASDKLPDPGPDTYRFQTHAHYLDGFMDTLVPDGPVILVVHDWGSALGFHWARRHADRVRAIAYMEGFARPIAGWEQWPEAGRAIFQAFRSDAGEEIVLDKNLFVERVLPGSILRELLPAEMEQYRKPFPNRSDRWPTLTWPREIPIGGEPADVYTIVSDFSQWMAGNQIPKLFINADPGVIMTGAIRDFCRAWPNQTEVTVKGLHFIQEDSGPEIGQAIAHWLAGLDQG